MEKTVCYYEPISKGFEHRWRIDSSQISSYSVLNSPVFEAFSWRWVIGLRSETASYRGSSDTSLSIALNLVDGKGNKIREIPSNPFFESNEMSAKISILDYGTVLLPAQVLSTNVPLKEKLVSVYPMGKIDLCNEVRSNSGKTVYEKQETKLGKSINAGAKIEVVFELRVALGKRQQFIVDKTQSLKNLFEAGKFSDFVIRTGDGREIHAHRLILSMNSSYFEGMFNSGGLEAQRGEIEVPEPFPVMNAIIRFLYTGEFSMGNESAVELFIAADKYQIEEFKEHFESAFEGDAEQLFSVENVCAGLIRVHALGIDRMKAKAAAFIRAHREEVEKTEGWRELCREHPEIIAYL